MKEMEIWFITRDSTLCKGEGKGGSYQEREREREHHIGSLIYTFPENEREQVALIPLL